MFDMAKMMKQAKDVQDKMMKMQEELAKTTFEGASSCGKVRISCNGKFEGWNVSIDSDVAGPEVAAKVREALEALTQKIMGQTQDKMSSLTKGLNIPGLKLPGFGG
jgi:DNA-binding YbaB/EbfC family protein